MPIIESGRELWANALGALNIGYYSGAATALEGSGHVTIKQTGAAWNESAFIGHDVYISGVVGTVISNTKETVTVARWEKLGARGTAGAEPTGTPAYYIAGGQTPALWMALSTDTSDGKTKEKVSEWNLEYYKAGGGLIRKVAEFSETTHGKPGAFTVKAKFTYNSSDSGEVKVGSIGIFNVANTTGDNKGPNGQKLLFWTALSSIATLSTEGDSVEITDTITGS